MSRTQDEFADAIMTAEEHRNLVHTMELTLAVALPDDQAHARRTAMAGSSARATYRFELGLMTKAATEPPTLPEALELPDSSRTLVLSVTCRDELLSIMVQARNDDAIDRIAGRWATLRSHDATIAEDIQFDRHGFATIALTSNPEIEAALSSVTIEIPSYQFHFTDLE